MPRTITIHFSLLAFHLKNILLSFRLLSYISLVNFTGKNMLSVNTMYQALVDRDKSFEGRFITAVKTTGIFCRPGCTARLPNKENVEFFNTAKEAILHGYRPCKVCHPLERPGETPGFIKEIIKEINDNPWNKLKDQHLRDKGIEPNTIRRWFKKNHGITFHSFQRMLRINSAFKKIKNGESISNTAYDSGYESLSGFNDSFKSLTGYTPSSANKVNIITIARLESPLGPMFAAVFEDKLCLLEFTDRRMLETEFKAINKTLKATILQGHHPLFEDLQKQLNEYFSGNRKEFFIPLFTPGSEFQRSVWEELQRIPFGSTRSYKEQATALNKPAAVRAVANSNGMNRIAILIPCHRVIGADGNLTGYGGGLWRKKFLLDLEKNYEFKKG